jgi:hypothetical protein
MGVGVRTSVDPTFSFIYFVNSVVWCGGRSLECCCVSNQMNWLELNGLARITCSLSYVCLHYLQVITFCCVSTLAEIPNLSLSGGNQPPQKKQIKEKLVV